MYVVASDNLSKISKRFYGTPNKIYTQIFRDQQAHAGIGQDLPGRVLRVPPDA
jgi:nucleoid-associated protein YgaU